MVSKYVNTTGISFIIYFLYFHCSFCVITLNIIENKIKKTLYLQ